MIGVDSGYVGMAAAIFFMFPFIAKDRISASRMFQMLSVFLFVIYLENQIAQIGNRNFTLFSKPFSEIMFLAAVACLVTSAIIFFIGRYIKIEKKFIWPVTYFVIAFVAAFIVIKR